MTRTPFPFLALVVVVVFGVLWAARADGQVVNPTAVVFTPSADHALLATYDLGYFAVGATAPIQSASIPKASLTSVGTDLSFQFPRLLFGVYEHKLRGCTAAPVVCSAWAPADKTSDVRPFSATAVRVQ